MFESKDEFAKATIDVKTLRAKFNAPCTSYCPRGRYCVGGAFVLGFYGQQPDPILPTFPTIQQLANTIKAANPALEATEANIYACDVIIANDNREFDRAWSILEEAMQ